MKKLFVSFFVIIFSACSIKNESSSTMYQQKQNIEKLGVSALSKNETDKALGYFEKALDEQSWYKSFWPFNAKFYYRLAMTHLRMDDFNKASSFFDKAAGPFNLNTFHARSKQLALFQNLTPYSMEGKSEVTIPFVTRDPLPVIQVRINESEPVNFFIDTGGEEIILDKKFAQKLGINIVSEIEGEYAGAQKGLTGLGKLERLVIGEMRIQNIPIQTIDLSPTNQHIFKNTNVHGVIGTRFLMHFLATIDYVNQQLILRKKSEEHRNTLLKHHPVIIPFQLFETHLIFAKGSFNGSNEGAYFIDTGLAGAGFLSSKSLLQQSGVVMDWYQSKIGAGGGGEVKALEVEIAQVTLGDGENSITNKELKGVVFEEDISLFQGVPLGFEVKGLISHEFFLDSAVTFDFEKMEMYIIQE